MENQEIDFTDTRDPQAIAIEQEIRYLTGLLKVPKKIIWLISAAGLGAIVGKRFGIGRAAGAAAGAGLTQLIKPKELTDEEKEAIALRISELQQQLQGFQVLEKGAIEGTLSAEDLQKISYPKYLFTGKWKEFIGQPAKGFHCIVYGMPKAGKSILCMQFADMLANEFGEVLYIAAEEGYKGTIKDKIKEWTTNRKRLHFAAARSEKGIREALETKDYKFCFIDSVDKAKLTVDEVEALKADYGHISFISIHQVTKQGDARGSQEFKHDADVLINVQKGGIAHQEGRYNAASVMEVFPSKKEKDDKK